MNRSRRRTLTLLSTAVALGSAGCIGADPREFGDSSDAARPPAADHLVVTVRGPDGEERFFSGGDVAAVGSIERADGSGYRVPVSLTDEATATAVETFRIVGGDRDPTATSVHYALEGGSELERTLDVSKSLAETIASGEWDGSFVLTATGKDEAETLRATLAAE